jgi:hypothetical protein
MEILETMTKKTRDFFVGVDDEDEQEPILKIKPISGCFLVSKLPSRYEGIMECRCLLSHSNTPIGHNRHVVCISLIRGVPLNQVKSRKLSSIF